MRAISPQGAYEGYASAWDAVARSGYRQYNVDTWANGRRYLSLTAVCLTAREVQQLRESTVRFSALFNVAVEGILADQQWWATLAWPWAAIELARQEPVHPGNQATLFGRFDFLLGRDGNWQVIEYNADTPSGGREATGLEPAVARLYGRSRMSRSLASRVSKTFAERVAHHSRPVTTVGVVSTHRWLEDLSQAVWLSDLLGRTGLHVLVGDVNDLATRRGRIMLRGERIDALYRFYPVERLYRHAIFASVWEAALDGKLLLLNGLRGFLAQSKACLAWLWANRRCLSPAERALVERHLPPTLMASDPDALALLPDAVIKHVNGREGDSVMFGSTLSAAEWEARLLEGGYVVQQVVRSPTLQDVEVDDRHRELRYVSNRYACVGAFAVGGQFAGCYTRLDGPVTSPRATYAATLLESV